MRVKRILVSVLIFVMVVIASGMIGSSYATGGATIWTDKPDYSPEEVVTIFGSGFIADNTVWLNLTRPDGWVDSWTTLADSYGNFTTLYVLDGIKGSYLVVATDGTNTATVTFTDAPKVSSVSVSPTSRSVSPSASVVYSMTVTRGPGSDSFTATFSVISSAPSIPAGAISFSPATITCTSSCPGSTLTISTSSLSSGTYIFKVRAARSVGDFADSGTITMIIDGTAPVIAASVSPAPNANGWNNGDVTVSWTVSDPQSGIASSTGCGTTVLNSETSGTTITCNATNGAGLSNSASVTVRIDKTGPSVSGSTSPGPNLNGWNNVDVTVSFVCSDSLSGVNSSSSPTTLSSEGSGQLVTGSCADKAGNSASATVNGINIDKTNPLFSGSRSPGPNSYGWNNGPVTVSFSCIDALSGVSSSPTPTVLAGEGAGQSATGSCTDNAGNSASSTVNGINIDLTSPEITGSRTPAPNAFGWNSADVTVSFTCSDSLSGVATGPVTPQVVTTEGSAQSRTGTCTDQADNSASATIGNINIDKTPPSITGSRSPDPDAAGWSSVDVTVSFACSDTLSGIASSPSPTVLGEGAGQAVSGICVDRAGNSASATVGDINIDLTPPSISGSRDPGPNFHGWNNGPVAVGFTCSDTLSGVSDATPGSTIDVEIVGLSLTGSCTDNAGNLSTTTVGPISIDITGPDISGSRSPSPNANGWNNADVRVHFECSDGLSGVDSVTQDKLVSTEEAGQSMDGTCVDLAGNSANATVGGINVDKTAPTIDGSRSPAPNNFGWNNGPVTVDFVCSDGLSGVSSVSPSQTIDTELVSLSLTGICTDLADNSASVIIGEINVDLTSPTIAGSRSPPANEHGWNNQDVTVTFVCEDGLSGIASSPTQTVLGGEGSGQWIGGTCEDKAGNVATATVEGINIDKTPPIITGSRTPDPNVYGWNSQDITVHFECSDSLSGVRSVTGDQTVSSEGAGQSVIGTCTDNAGNSVSTSIGSGINIDKTVPSVIGSRTPGPNAYGWNNANVEVYFSCSDTLSGVAVGPTTPQWVNDEGTDQSRTATCTDLAGNMASATVGSISIDKSSPTLAGSRSPGANSFGWNNGAVTVSFTCSDALSGTASVTGPTTLSSEGAGQSVSGTCMDKAGNLASASLGGINIDLTRPTATISSPTAGTYALNALVPASWLVSDSLSGINPVTVTATAPNGANVDTSTIGTKTFIVSAIDKAGNYESQTVTYQVVYSQTCGRRILSPLEQVSSSAQLTKTYKRGSTLPIKFQLCDGNGNYLGTAIATVHVYKVNNSVDAGDEVLVADSGYSDSGSNVCRYDSTANQYIYNLSTKTYSAGTYRLEVHLDDGTTITTYFQLAK